MIKVSNPKSPFSKVTKPEILNRNPSLHRLKNKRGKHFQSANPTTKRGNLKKCSRNILKRVALKSCTVLEKVALKSCAVLAQRSCTQLWDKKMKMSVPYFVDPASGNPQNELKTETGGETDFKPFEKIRENFRGFKSIIFLPPVNTQKAVLRAKRWIWNSFSFKVGGKGEIIKRDSNAI